MDFGQNGGAFERVEQTFQVRVVGVTFLMLDQAAIDRQGGVVEQCLKVLAESGGIRTEAIAAEQKTGARALAGDALLRAGENQQVAGPERLAQGLHRVASPDASDRCGLLKN